MGRFPSGQREQTVNLPSPTSMVRIHPCPPSSAGMAELADALDSGSSESNFMQVQVLFPAPKQRPSSDGLLFFANDICIVLSLTRIRVNLYQVDKRNKAL